MFSKIIVKVCLFLFLVSIPRVLQGEEISYYYDVEEHYTIYDIAKAEFTPFSKRINNGVENGVYWIKISGLQDANPHVIRLTNNRIIDTELYVKQQLVKSLASFRFVTFEFSPEGKTVYLRVKSLVEANIPIEILTKEEFLKNEQRNSIVTGLFYGFALMVIIINFFYYFNFKEDSFLLYGFFLITICLSFSHRDGIIHLLGLSKELVIQTDGYAHTLTGILGALFAINYLDLKSNFPKFRIILIFIVSGSLLFDIFFSVTGNFLFYAMSDSIIYFVFFGCWFASVLMFKRHFYAAIFCIAYSLITLLITDFYVFPAWGIKGLAVSLNVLKFGGYLEMLTITYAVVFKMNTLRKENETMQKALFDHTSQIERLEEQLQKLNSGEENEFSKAMLNRREIEVLTLISKGKTNKEMADDLFISVNTVKYHTKNLYNKLAISSRQEAKIVASEIAF